MSLEKAAYLDQTGFDQPAGCLRTVTCILHNFKEEYPRIWKELCDRGLMFSEFSLQDSSDGLIAASEELNKCLTEQE